MQETRDKHDKQIEDNKKRLMSKIENTDERIKKQKLEQEHESQKKYNRIYMMREDRKIRVVQNEKIQNFERQQKMEKINERMERIEDMKREKYLLDEERRKIENEMNNKKVVMMDRLRKVMKSDEYFTKDEIIDYVFHDIKPNSHKNDENNDNENGNKDKEKKRMIKILQMILEKKRINSYDSFFIKIDIFII